MDLAEFIGQTFFENEFYELLLFQIEENREKFFSKFMHFHFIRSCGKIVITELVHFKDDVDMFKKARTNIEKQEWFEIYDNHGHIDLMLCRFDRSGKRTVFYINGDTRTHNCSLGWADETPHRPMTRDEIREAFQELAGVFNTQQEQQSLSPKKAI